MDAREFAEWIAYAQIEPFGEVRNDQRAGAIASTIVNVNQKKGSKAKTWKDFFPPHTNRRSSLGWQELLAKVEALNTELGGVDKRNRS